jgi:hypothetical protein
MHCTAHGFCDTLLLIPIALATSLFINTHTHTHTNTTAHSTRNPWTQDDCWASHRNASGALTADPERFPSGIDGLTAWLHDRGFKFGLSVHGTHASFIVLAHARTYLLTNKRLHTHALCTYAHSSALNHRHKHAHALRAHTRPHLITHSPRHVRLHTHALHTHADDRLTAHLPLFSSQVHVSGECDVLQRGAPIPHPWLKRPLRPRRKDIRFVGC